MDFAPQNTQGDLFFFCQRCAKVQGSIRETSAWTVLSKCKFQKMLFPNMLLNVFSCGKVFTIEYFFTYSLGLVHFQALCDYPL